MSRTKGAGKKIYINGELMTLDEVRMRFGYNDNAAVIKAIKRRINNNNKYGPISRLADYEVKYEKD